MCFLALNNQHRLMIVCNYGHKTKLCGNETSPLSKTVMNSLYTTCPAPKSRQEKEVEHLSAKEPPKKLMKVLKKKT